MYCNFCGKEIPDDVKFCPECGRIIAEDAHVIRQVEYIAPPKRKPITHRWWFWILLLILSPIILPVFEFIVSYIFGFIGGFIEGFTEEFAKAYNSAL